MLRAAGRLVRVGGAARAAVVLVAILLGAGRTWLALAGPPVDAPSPAQGHAEIIANGVVTLPAGQLAWRAVSARADLPASATAQARPLGFVLADQGPILVTDVDSGQQHRLPPGAATLSPGGARELRVSLGARPVTYDALDLVPASDRNDAGGATVIAAGMPFAAPAGNVDLELLRDVLAAGEQNQVADNGNAMLLLVMQGTVQVQSGMGPASFTLSAGQARQVGGNLGLVNRGTDDAAYVIALIGPAIPPATTPTPPIAVATATAAPPTVTPVLAATGTVASTPPAVGTVTVVPSNCPSGSNYDNFQTTIDLCQPVSAGFDVSLTSANRAVRLTLADAVYDSQTRAYTWRNVPLFPGGAGYTLTETVLPPGYTAYSIRGNATAAGGGAVTFDLTPDAPTALLGLFNLQPEGATGSITIQTLTCPSGMTAATLNPSQCMPLSGGGLAMYVFHKYRGAMGGGVLDQTQATVPQPGTFVWSDLVIDGYQLHVTILPSGYTSAAVGGVAGDPTSGDFGQWPVLPIDPTTPDASVALFLFP